MVHGPAKAPRLVVVELGEQLRVPGLVGIGGKLHSDWLGGAGGLGAIQMLNGVLSLHALVKTDESHTSGET